MLTAYLNKTYWLKDCEDVVNESRLKLYHSVNTTAVDKPDDRQDAPGFKPDIPSVEDSCCEDIIRSDGVHCNASNDQQTSTTEKRKASQKWLIIENFGQVGRGATVA